MSGVVSNVSSVSNVSNVIGVSSVSISSLMSVMLAILIMLVVLVMLVMLCFKSNSVQRSSRLKSSEGSTELRRWNCYDESCLHNIISGHKKKNSV
jgi:hypothetical protein